MKIRKLVLALASIAIGGTMLMGTAAAAPGATVYVVHGIPGAKVDVCVDGAEVKSNFVFGRKFALKDVPVGEYDIKVLLADDRECKGTTVINVKDLALSDGLNATAVAKLGKGGAPELKIFVNDISLSGADKASVTVRHTAKAPTVDVWVNGGGAPLVPGFTRNSEAGPVEVDEGVYSYWAAAAGDYAPVIGADVSMLEGGKAYQIHAVGTDASNYRFVVIGQAGELA